MTTEQLRRANAVWRDLVPFVALGLAAWAVLINGQRTDEVEREALERRDQNCVLFERQEISHTQRVIRTYDYLDSLPRSEYGTNLTKAIVRGLPDQYAEAAANRAPAYCNEKPREPLVGLPESEKFSPQLPRQRDYSHVLERPVGFR